MTSAVRSAKMIPVPARLGYRRRHLHPGDTAGAAHAVDPAAVGCHRYHQLPEAQEWPLSVLPTGDDSASSLAFGGSAPPHNLPV